MESEFEEVARPILYSLDSIQILPCENTVFTRCVLRKLVGGTCSESDMVKLICWVSAPDREDPVVNDLTHTLLVST